MKKIYLTLCAVCAAALMAGCQSAIDTQGKMVGWSQIHKGPDKYVYFVGADGKKYRCNKKYNSFYPGPVRPIPVTDAEWDASFGK